MRKPTIPARLLLQYVIPHNVEAFFGRTNDFKDKQMTSLPFLCPSDLVQSNTLCLLHHLSKEVKKDLSHYSALLLGDYT